MASSGSTASPRRPSRPPYPGFPEYRFNVARGVLPGGRYGVLFHQLLEVPVTGSAEHQRRRSTRPRSRVGRWWMPALPDRTDIPYIGAFLDGPTDHRPAEAFDSHAVWIPTTTVAINVPETALPYFLTRIDRRDQARAVRLPAPAARSPAAGGCARTARCRTRRSTPILARHADDPYFAVHVLRGTVIVRRNGYLADLDELTRDACAIADALAAASPSDPRPFADPLPAPHSHHPEVTPGWRDGYAQLAARLRLTQEDADAYQRAFPTLGVPGRAVAVMRGELAPGVHGRLVYCRRAQPAPGRARPRRRACSRTTDRRPRPAASATPTGTSSTSSATASPCSGACARRASTAKNRRT